MRPIYLTAFAGLLLSCGQSNKKTTATDSIPPSVPVIASHADAIRKEVSPDTLAVANAVADTVHMRSEKNEVAHWKDFWLKMKTAIATKDTATIIGLTYFPFFCNSSLSQVDDFKEAIIDQVFSMNLKKTGEPKFEGSHDFGGRDDQTNTSENLKCDSTFYLYEPHKVVYFGKVKGYYKLLGMETPG
jgi:hypothetical protein